MKVYTFPRGGINFVDPSAPSGGGSRIAFLPGISIIPLGRTGGERVKATVEAGDQVREGMVVARALDGSSTNIHATVPGRVIRLVARRGCGGGSVTALVIRMEGSFELLGKREIPHPWENLSPAELGGLLSEHGIVEMEGEGRPVTALLEGDGGRPGDSLVVRCVFDDPWLAADRVLCRERLEAVVEGSFIAARAGRLKRLVFAVSGEEGDMGARLLERAERGKYPVSLVLVGSRYPQGNRRELDLVLRLYGKRESLDLGNLVILGPATLAAVRDAVVLRKPVLDRYVAVGGTAVKSPQVIRVRLGTRIGELFAECGGFVQNPARIATGSPFLGRPVADLDEPVVKTSYAVFALLEDGKDGGDHVCISCGECRAVCPVGFDPEELYKQERMGFPAPPASAGEPSCHGCGCCELVCPSRLPLSSVLGGLTRRHSGGA